MFVAIKQYLIVGSSCFILGLVSASLVGGVDPSEIEKSNHAGVTKEYEKNVDTYEAFSAFEPSKDESITTRTALEAEAKPVATLPQANPLRDYKHATSSEQKIQSKRVLMNLEDSTQHDIATQLIEDENQSDRLLAYQLISSNPQAVIPESIEATLIQNSYVEADPQALAANVAALRNVSRDSEHATHVRDRLRELSNHHYSDVRAKAISALGFQDDSEETRALVIDAINDSSSKVRLAAARTLFNFERLADSDYDNLLMIASDVNEDLKVRQETLILLDEHERRIAQSSEY